VKTGIHWVSVFLTGARWKPCTRQKDSREKKKRSFLPFFVLVVPAKAGIQFVKCSSKKQKNLPDSGFRRNDESKEKEVQLPFLGS